MDCCNLVHQGHPYYNFDYNQCSSFPRGYASRHPYNNVLYYNNQWMLSSSVTDYVYNPKEARIRKAMRERERNMANGGTSQSVEMQRAARRSPPWVPPPPQDPAYLSHLTHAIPPFTAHQEMLSSFKNINRDMRTDYDLGNMDPGCEYPFPNSSYLPTTHHTGVQPYIHLPPNEWIANSYIQRNPALHQEIWNQYHSERLREQKRELERNYTFHSEEPPYLQIEHLANDSKLLQRTENTSKKYTNKFSDCMVPKHDSATNSSHEINTPINVMDVAASCEETYSLKTNNEDHSSSFINDDQPINLATGSSHPFMNYAKTDEKSDICLPKKEQKNVKTRTAPKNQVKTSNTHHQRWNVNTGNSLPGFNQAFGSTERGRYQSASEPISLDIDYIDKFPAFNVKLDQYSMLADNSNTTDTPPLLFTKDFAKVPF